MSLEFVGKGEGVQAYGWGLYFAESPDVSAAYMRAGEYSLLINKKPLGTYQWFRKLPQEDRVKITSFFDMYSDDLDNKEKWMKDLYGFAIRGEPYWERLY
jgi:hypothetical protein